MYPSVVFGTVGKMKNVISFHLFYPSHACVLCFSKHSHIRWIFTEQLLIEHKLATNENNVACKLSRTYK